MAYYDENGRITIDEVAAQADIRKIETVIALLNNSKKTINNLIQQATSEKGQAASAIIEKATEMKKQIDSMISRLSETASFISRTVSHYQSVDQKLKEAINAAHTAVDAATIVQATTKPETVKGFFNEFKKSGGKK